MPPGAGTSLSAALVLEAMAFAALAAPGHTAARAWPVPGALCGGAAMSDARAGWDGPGRRRPGRARLVGNCGRASGGRCALAAASGVRHLSTVGTDGDLPAHAA